MGKLTTQEAIFGMWAKRKGADCCEIEKSGITPFDKRLFWIPTDVQRVDFISKLKDYGKADAENLIFYWRMITLPGALMDCGPYLDKEHRRIFGNKRAM